MLTSFFCGCKDISLLVVNVRQVVRMMCVYFVLRCAHSGVFSLVLKAAKRCAVAGDGGRDVRVGSSRQSMSIGCVCAFLKGEKTRAPRQPSPNVVSLEECHLPSGSAAPMSGASVRGCAEVSRP